MTTTWQHSHNLRETTRDRLESVLRELRVQRASCVSAVPQDDEQAELERVDRAISLLQQALETLAG